MLESPTTIITPAAIARDHPEAIETERKFLARQASQEDLRNFERAMRDKEGVKVSHIQQGYVSRDVIKKVRLRIVRDDANTVKAAYLTLKGPPDQENNNPKSRLELEVPIPADKLQLFLDLFPVLCPDSLHKTRYSYEHRNKDKGIKRKYDIDQIRWSPEAQAMLDAHPDVAQCYNHLVTVDVELDPADSSPFNHKDYFPKFLRPFLCVDGQDHPIEITRNCLYRSAEIAALNSRPTEEYVAELRALIQAAEHNTHSHTERDWLLGAPNNSRTR